MTKQPDQEDMRWLPSCDRSAMRARAQMYADIRAFFAERSVLEVETSVLSQYATTDVHIQSIQAGNRFLHTSPEFAMKRLLAAGSGCIYQICKAFRQEETGRKHNTEFSMLEWYRVGFDHIQLMAEVDKFMQTILGCPAAEQISYQQLFLKTVNIDPLQRDLQQLQQYVVASGILASEPYDLDYDTLLHLVFSHQIEPALGQHKPVLVHGYPASQSALAKINADDERIADRFELYYKGVELANGFNELTNSTEQAARFEHDNTQRQAVGLPTMPADINLIAALSNGLPNCAGVALGLDRLLMLKLGVSHIHEVIAFPNEIA